MEYTVGLLSMLYELSLTNLKHGKPEDMARKFVKKLISRKSIEFGAVWKTGKIDAYEANFHCIYAIPAVEQKLKLDVQVILPVLDNDHFFISDHSLMTAMQSIGSYAYFRLGTYGILELFDSGRTFSRQELDPFTDVMNQFALSLESSNAFDLLRKEIREREKAEKLVRANQEKYRRIIDNIKLGLLEVDNHEVVQFANKPFLELTGYKLGEIIGKKASKIFVDDNDQESLTRIHEENQSREQGLSTSYEIKLKNKHGDFRHAIVSGAPNYDDRGQLIGSIGIHLDITEEKILREENEFKSEQLRKLYDKSLDAVVSMDEEGRIFEWSPQAESIFGYKRSEILGMKMSESIIPHQYREAHDKGMDHYLATGEGPVLNKRIQITALKNSGIEFPVELTIFPIVFRNVQYFTAFIRDITELKESEENMEKALERQKELNNLKSKFISMTSHELRTPLTTIKSNTELIAYQLDHQDDLSRDKLTRNIVRIENNVERLNQLINNILLIGKLDSKKVPFEPEPLDVARFIETKILPDFKTRGHALLFKSEVASLNVLLDSKLFSQVIINLIENAIKYTIGDKPPEITLCLNKANIEIMVKDYGIGIPEEDQEKLFSTFYRASNVGNIQGSGLGLVIVKEFVELNGGEISFTSKLNEGSTFTITFPLS